MCWGGGDYEPHLRSVRPPEAAGSRHSLALMLNRSNNSNAGFGNSGVTYTTASARPLSRLSFTCRSQFNSLTTWRANEQEAVIRKRKRKYTKRCRTEGGGVCVCVMYL